MHEGVRRFCIAINVLHHCSGHPDPLHHITDHCSDTVTLASCACIEMTTCALQCIICITVHNVHYPREGHGHGGVRPAHPARAITGSKPPWSMQKRRSGGQYCASMQHVRKSSEKDKLGAQCEGGERGQEESCAGKQRKDKK
jgi:hypothetical protein